MRKLILIFYSIILLAASIGCTTDRPEISEEALLGSASIIEGHGEIEDAEIIVEDGKIKFYLVPLDEEVSAERLRTLGIDFLTILAGYTVNDGLEGSTEESYGEIYEYYDVEIIIEGERGAVLDSGIKGKGESDVEWQE